MKRGLVLLSGGLDSSILLALYKVHPDLNMKALFVDYGQRNIQEKRAAIFISSFLKVELITFSMNLIKFFKKEHVMFNQSSKIPKQELNQANMQIVKIPGRNLLFISIAHFVAANLDMDFIAFGALKGSMFPDCKPGFFQAAKTLVYLADDLHVSLEAPHIQYSKWEAVKLANRLVPNFPLEMTYSCYSGEKIHCGICSTCRARREAFKLAEVIDKTGYQNDKIL
jgi:7-cyano-7-deazaguanine synthase